MPQKWQDIQVEKVNPSLAVDRCIKMVGFEQNARYSYIRYYRQCLLQFFSSQKAFEMPGARSVSATVAEEAFINNLHSAAGGGERPLSNSDELLASSASLTEP
ncbi:hypothetical protein J6590_062569 [Homalodisca vitripennis]|nr:hypothetical protein J6590_062569 [Homalodisca vitripennis]